MATKYKAIKVDGTKHDVHRYIMEQHLGRKLRSDEHVHHLNEDPRDNRIENLVVMDRAEHARMHQTGRKASEATKKKLSERMMGRPNVACQKLTESEVHFIRDNYTPYDKELGARALAKRFNISHPSIVRIARGDRYATIK